ncbi:hypothetical protein OsJ_33218 [Oryza sativa Japonica Group]|uniref:Reverse transcriptase zinc-binding domain-containing protein n=1 Tax=Oryza sativa subsp. japonica TaxID=39947 RepID=B9G9R7_ORYSJ|nr:hypothetical protein OsJ_33218 [Oryza sativa Japonica Group]
MELFGCSTGQFPFRYLGIPIHYRRLRNADWKEVVECFEKRLSSWKGKLLSTGGRLTLINSVLSSLPLYMMSFFAIPIGILTKLDYFRSRFYWQSDGQKKVSLMKVKRDFLRFGSFIIKDGSQIRFWEDKWLGNSTLKEQYPYLYNIVRHKHATVAQVFENNPPSFSWRRDLIGSKLAAWNNLLPRITGFHLTQEQDEFHWNLTSNGEFSVKSHYLALIHSNVPNINNCLWKLKIPLKVKIFLWYLRRGMVLTKDNLIKRKWQGNKNCCFCCNDETIRHLFFECRFALSVWSIIQAASGLPPPHCVAHMFGSWLDGIHNNLKSHVLLGAAATCWSLWLCRNNVVFDKKKSYLHLCRLYILLSIGFVHGLSYRSLVRRIW